MTSYRSGSYGIKSPADRNVTYYHADAASSGIKYPAEQDPVLYNIMLIWFYL